MNKTLKRIVLSLFALVLTLTSLGAIHASAATPKTAKQKTTSEGYWYATTLTADNELRYQIRSNYKEKDKKYTIKMYKVDGNAENFECKLVKKVKNVTANQKVFKVKNQKPGSYFFIIETTLKGDKKHIVKEVSDIQEMK